VVVMVVLVAVDDVVYALYNDVEKHAEAGRSRSSSTSSRGGRSSE